VAMWQGFNEFFRLGWIDKLPKLAASQSAAAAPIAAAYEKNMPSVEPVEARETIAESIQVGNPSALGERALGAIRDSRGSAVAVTDGEILEAQSLIGSLTGIFAEPAAATSVAAAKKLCAEGKISPDQV